MFTFELELTNSSSLKRYRGWERCQGDGKGTRCHSDSFFSLIFVWGSQTVEHTKKAAEKNPAAVLVVVASVEGDRKIKSDPVAPADLKSPG